MAASSRPVEWRHFDVILSKSTAAILAAAMFVGDRTTASTALAGAPAAVVYVLQRYDCGEAQAAACDRSRRRLSADIVDRHRLEADRRLSDVPLPHDRRDQGLDRPASQYSAHNARHRSTAAPRSVSLSARASPCSTAGARCELLSSDRRPVLDHFSFRNRPSIPTLLSVVLCACFHDRERRKTAELIEMSLFIVLTRRQSNCLQTVLS